MRIFDAGSNQVWSAGFTNATSAVPVVSFFPPSVNGRYVTFEPNTEPGMAFSIAEVQVLNADSRQGATLSYLGSAIPGLRMFSTTTPDWQRQELRTLPANQVSWIGRPGTTYSFTITNFPGSGYNQYMAHLYFAPGDYTAANDPSWRSSDCLVFKVQRTSAGVVGSFCAKTGDANNEGNLYSTGVVGSITNTSALGTWSVTFNNDTNVTIAGPGGLSSTFDIPIDPSIITGTYGCRRIPQAILVNPRRSAGSS
jgi:hypothetical protein